MSKSGSDADDTDDDHAEAEPVQRSQGRLSARGRRLSRQPSQNAGRGTRPLNASLRRDRSQFEVDELQSHASQGIKRRRVRGRAAGRGRAEVSQAGRSQANQVQASRESSAESCIIIP